MSESIGPGPGEPGELHPHRQRRVTDIAGRTIALDPAQLAAALCAPGGTSSVLWRRVVAGDVVAVVTVADVVALSRILVEDLAWHPAQVGRAVRHVVRYAEVVDAAELTAVTRPGEVEEALTSRLSGARLRHDRTDELRALHALRARSASDPERWRTLSAELAVVALETGRREYAVGVARDVIASFDAVADEALDQLGRRDLVRAHLVATAGQEYLTHEQSDEALDLLLRVIGRLGEDTDAALLLCRAAEIIGMRPHAGAFLRPWRIDDADGGEPASARRADELLERAERIIGTGPATDARLTASLDVAWARAHPHHQHAPERRARLDRSLRSLVGFDRAWAGTRLALDALAVGDRAALQQALIDASPTSVGRSALVEWRLGTVRAMLLLATGSPDARRAVEEAAAFGAEAREPMAATVAMVQRGVVRVEADPTPMTDEEARLDGAEVHPLIRIGRLELVTRTRAVRRCAVGTTTTVDLEHLDAAHVLANVVRSGGMNPGNQQLAAVLLARTIHNFRDLALPDALVEAVAQLLEPLEDLVPTDALGLVCAGSAARHLANLRALQGRSAQAEALADRARLRDEALGFERFVISGRIDAIVRARLAGRALDPELRAEALRCADEAERRALHLLAREARLVAHEGLQGRLDDQQLALLGELAAGERFPAIAERWGYSEGTMRKLALPVYRALGVGGRREAVAVALIAGLVAGPPGGRADG